jgi:hypothetical protein
MPDQMTESEQQCCKEMANDCSGSGMSHECCRTVVRADVATLTASNRGIANDFGIAEMNSETGAFYLSIASVGEYLSRNLSPPIDSGPSSIVLRI